MRVLVLGAAGMTLGKGAPCALDVTLVDIDPAQERIAALFLEVPTGKAGRFAASGARAFLRATPGPWRRSWSTRTPTAARCPSPCSPPSSTASPGRGSLYLNHLVWPDDALFRTRAERTLRSALQPTSPGAEICVCRAKEPANRGRNN